MNGIQRISPSLSEKLPLRQESAYHQAGFTLLELMVVIAILGILTAVAVPELKSQMEHAAVNNATVSLLAKLKQARSLAVADTRDVVVTFDTINQTFTYDDNNAGVCAMCSNTQIELSQYSPSLAVTTNANLGITFKSRGSVSNAGTVKLKVGNYYKCVRINMIGRAYVLDKPSAGDMSAPAVTCRDFL